MKEGMSRSTKSAAKGRSSSGRVRPPQSGPEICLSQAPDVFFDKKQWEEFVAQFETREIALARISTFPFYCPTGFLRDGDPSLPAAGEERARKIKKTLEIGQTLVFTFLTQLISGEIVATAIECPWDIRETIPAERWRGFWPEFANDSAMGFTGRFVKIRVRSSDNPHVQKTFLSEQLLDWLRERNGNELPKKNVLYSEAVDEFGPDRVTTRSFNTAYKKAFNRPRGRPSKK